MLRSIKGSWPDLSLCLNSYSFVVRGCPLWREGRSVSCQKSALVNYVFCNDYSLHAYIHMICPLSKFSDGVNHTLRVLSILHVCVIHGKNIFLRQTYRLHTYIGSVHKATISPGFVQQQIVPYIILLMLQQRVPITVAARSKAWTVFARSNAGIVVSNPTRGMDVCLCLFCVCVR
jgi:hypothetical protein